MAHASDRSVLRVSRGRRSSPARPACAFLLAAAGAVLAGAFGFEHLGGLAPCTLCLYERVPYALTVALCAAALGWRAVPSRPVLAASALCLLVGSGLAAYHVGVEQGVFASSCGGGVGAATLDELRARIMSQSGPACSDVGWSFLGLSLAAWNGLIGLALGGFAAWAALGGGRRRA